MVGQLFYDFLLFVRLQRQLSFTPIPCTCFLLSHKGLYDDVIVPYETKQHYMQHMKPWHNVNLHRMSVLQLVLPSTEAFCIIIIIISKQKNHFEFLKYLSILQSNLQVSCTQTQITKCVLLWDIQCTLGICGECAFTYNIFVLLFQF